MPLAEGSHLAAYPHPQPFLQQYGRGARFSLEVKLLPGPFSGWKPKRGRGGWGPFSRCDPSARGMLFPVGILTAALEAPHEGA